MISSEKKDYNKKYYEANKERLSSQNRNYREENKERLIEVQRKHYQEKKEEIRRKQGEYLKRTAPKALLIEAATYLAKYGVSHV